MKMLTLCLMVILFTTITSYLYSESGLKLQLQGVDAAYDVFTKKTIFYINDNNVLLIDFKEVRSRLSRVKLIHKGILLLEDQVSDLAEDSIYELDMTEYGKGDYEVTLVTIDEDEISERFIVE